MDAILGALRQKGRPTFLVSPRALRTQQLVCFSLDNFDADKLNTATGAATLIAKNTNQNTATGAGVICRAD